MTLCPQDCRVGGNPGEWQALLRRSFFTAAGLFGDEAFSHQETVSGNAQAGVMMKPSPTTSLVMAQPEVLLQVLIVTLDTPALVGNANQHVERRILGQRRQIVLARLVFLRWPLDEQLLLRTQPGLARVAAGVAHAQGSKPIAQHLIRSLAPMNELEGLGRQRQGQCLDVHGLALGRAPRHDAQAAPPAIRLGRQRLDTRWPDHHGRGHAHHLGQPHIRQGLPKRGVHAVAGVGQHGIARRAFGQQRVQLRQRNLRLRRKLHRLRHAGLGSAFDIGGPLLGQIQLLGHRQTVLIAGQ